MFFEHDFFTRALSLISQIVTLAGFGTLIDSLAKPEDRKVIASYIRKTDGVTFDQFELAIIRSAIKVFCDKNGNLSPLKIWVYSLSGAIISTLLIIIIRHGQPVFGSQNAIGPDLVQVSLIALFIAPIIAYLSYPSDVLSLHITKRIFLRPNRKNYMLPLYWLLDTILSLLVTAVPIVILYVLSTQLINSLFNEGELKYTLYPLIGATAVSCMLSVFVSVFQLSAIIAGNCCRGTIAPMFKYLNLFRGKLNFEAYPVAVTLFSVMTIYALLAYSMFVIGKLS